MTNTKQKQQLVRLSVSFDPESTEKLDQICKSKNGSRSATLRQLVREYSL